MNRFRVSVIRKYLEKLNYSENTGLLLNKFREIIEMLRSKCLKKLELSQLKVNNLFQTFSATKLPLNMCSWADT